MGVELDKITCRASGWHCWLLFALIVVMYITGDLHQVHCGIKGAVHLRCILLPVVGVSYEAAPVVIWLNISEDRKRGTCSGS